MNNIKKYMLTLGYTLGIIIIFTLIISILNYFDLINNTVFNIIKLIIPIVSSMFGGFLIGKQTERNGYQSGIKFGLVIASFSLLISLIFTKLSLDILLFLIIIIISSMLGSMIGINKKVPK